MSLGFKRLNSSVQNLPSTVSSHFAFSQPIFYPVLFNIRNNIAFCRVPRICPLFFWYNNVCMNMTDLQAKNTLSFIWISSPYRAVNTSSLIKANQLMLYREIIAVCSEIHTKHINTLCGQNVDIFVFYTAQYDTVTFTFRRPDLTAVCCNVTPYGLPEDYNRFQETQFFYPQNKTEFSVLEIARQPNAPAAFTPGEIPGTHFQRLSRPQGTWFCRW